MSARPSLYLRTIFGGKECELPASDGGEEGKKLSSIGGGIEGE